MTRTNDSPIRAWRKNHGISVAALVELVRPGEVGQPFAIVRRSWELIEAGLRPIDDERHLAALPRDVVEAHREWEKRRTAPEDR